MAGASTEASGVLALYLEIAQYPILAARIRQRMRQELFNRRIIAREQFEAEVKDKAILSQAREGIVNPYSEESEEVWQTRVTAIRDNLTDFYFAYNLPHSRFREIMREVLAERAGTRPALLAFNPELAPLEMLIAQAEEYEARPPERQTHIRHHLQEIYVVLIKSLISDHLSFIRIAKEWFTAEDFQQIRQRRIGGGKIGGKAAGMLLAWRILQNACAMDRSDWQRNLVLPESYFIGTDVFYDFHSLNGFIDILDQKYKSPEEIETDYPDIQRQYARAQFPEHAKQRLRDLLHRIGNRPLIVRSSSLLEDNLGTSFAGKYESLFCPNQRDLDRNVEDLCRAISQVYASVFNPAVLAYRRHKELLDYDERMAILLQEVQGQPHGRLFFPTLAGVAFGRNPYRWTQRIVREDGFVRLVAGLGTRAVNRVGQDYPRMIALSHPLLRPEVGARDIRRYSQRFLDVLDLQDNLFQSLHAERVLAEDLPGVRYLVSLDSASGLRPMTALDPEADPQRMVLTFDTLLKNSTFVEQLKFFLKHLEQQYHVPVDVEFTAEIIPDRPRSRVAFHILQCRPQSYTVGEHGSIPVDIPLEDQLFTANRMVPDGKVERIRYVVYVDPEAYHHLSDETTRLQLARIIGRINRRLAGQPFILMGPGRWGSINSELGVKVTYADIHNARMLIEVAMPRGDGAPEASYGTHFFQDLVEARIFPLPLYPDEDDTVFDWSFFRTSPNHLAELSPEDAGYAEYVKIIDGPAVRQGRLLEVVMDGETEQAIAYWKRYEQPR